MTQQEALKTSCTLQVLCYNADNRNKLSNKGLPVTRTRPFRIARLICLLTAIVAFGVPTQSAFAQTTTAKKKLSLKKAPKRAYSARASRARRAKVARARAAAAARQLAEAKQPQFKLDAAGALVPDIRAAAAIIYNPENGQVLWESNSETTRSIASITKVMTAAVFLENDPDLTQEVVITRADVTRASTTYLRAGYRITTGDLLHLLLIGSDNAAARALARVSPYGSDAFIDRMNAKADELKLDHTYYADPSGLLAANVSSAYDMARLISFVAKDDRIASVMQKAEHTASVGRTSVTVRSTNQLVRNGDVDVVSGKTGFISKAGYCLATLLRLPEGGPQVAVVVLGAKSNAGRFWETRHLFNWIGTKTQDLFATKVEAAGPGTN
jgi:serine-type D-Ala-D-Ala endopeptidase (penicillin-binding protein 7)